MWSVFQYQAFLLFFVLFLPFFSHPAPPAPDYKCSTIGLLTVGELASFPGRLVGHSEDTGRLLHHPDQEVVDVVLQLPDVRVLPPQELFVFHQLLQHLLVGQAAIACRGIEGVALLKRMETVTSTVSDQDEPQLFQTLLPILGENPWDKFTEWLASSQERTRADACLDYNSEFF